MIGRTQCRNALIARSRGTVFERNFVRDHGLGDSPTVTRASSAYVTDWEGLLKLIPSNGAQIEGARPVYNLVPQTEGDTGWAASGTTPPTVQQSVSYGGKTCISATIPAGVSGGAACKGTGSSFSITVGRQYTTRFLVAANRPLVNSESVTVYISGTLSFATVTFSTGKNISSSFTLCSSVGYTAASSGTAYYSIRPETSLESPITIYITERQVTDVTGQSNQNPAEYVSRGVLSAPYHGYGADGLKYFFTQNGNTVTNNIVTEATGTALTGPFPLILEPAATCANWYSEDFGSWGKAATLTRSLSATRAPHGNFAWDIGFGAAYDWIQDTHTLAVPAGGTCVATIFVANSGDAFYVKVQDTASHVAQALITPASKTVGSPYAIGDLSFVSGYATGESYVNQFTRYALVFKNNGSVTRNLYVGIAGTASFPKQITASGVNLCAGQNLTSYIYTGAAPVTRAQDVISWPLTTPQAQGMVVVKVRLMFAPDSTASIGFVSFAAAGTLGQIYFRPVGNEIRISDGTLTPVASLAWVSGSEYYLGSRWNTASQKMQIGWKLAGSGSWTWGTEAAYDGSFPTIGALTIQGILGTIKTSLVSVYSRDHGREWIQRRFS